jgi:methyl-accepting chemotaxis protein
VEEMNKALMQLEGMTQQNAALVEEAAASALTFKEEAARLEGLVGRFQLEESERLPQPAAVAAAAPRIRPPAGGRALRELGHKGPRAARDEEWQEF